MKNIIRTSSALLLVIACSMPAAAQKGLIIGVSVNGFYYSDAIYASPGLTMEARLSKHSGLESGLFYRTDRFRTSFFTADSIGPNIYPLVISQRFISVPLLYKYYSKKLNVSAGPLVDIFTGWKQKSPKSGVMINEFAVQPQVKVGFIAKLSKTINLDKKWMLEPEIRLGFLRSIDELGFGAGIAAKYRF